jgi:transposase
MHNLRPGRIGGRTWQGWWDGHRMQVPPLLRAEIEREYARLVLAKQQLNALETERRHAIAKGAHPVVAQLAKLRAIGPRGAWILDKELFGWRRFANRRELAGCLGLAPTPYASGTSESEQGISKAGNKRARALLVELAWRWLKFQPDSALSRWFQQRFGIAGKRSRRIGIVALARRLAIALWRYVEHSEIPAGATLKTIDV